MIDYLVIFWYYLFMSYLEHAVIAYANYFQFEPAMVIRNEEVHSRMLLWCTSGHGDVICDGTQYSLSERRFLFLPWKHSITYRADRVDPFRLAGVHLIPFYSPELPFRAKVVHNREQKWWEECQVTDIHLPNMAGILSGSFTDPPGGLQQLATYTINRYLSGGYSRRIAHHLATLLLDELKDANRLLSNSLKEGDLSRMDRITDHIIRNLHGEMSLEQLCRIGAVSPSTLRRLFVKAKGVSPYEWVLGARIERARYLLRTTSYPIERICAEVGFPDPSYFTRVFKGRTGVSPSLYRRTAIRI